MIKFKYKSNTNGLGMAREHSERDLWTKYAQNKSNIKTDIKISEHQHQKTFVQYCDLNNIPVFAIPNAQVLSFLNRDAAMKVVAKLKHEGLKRGVPDLFIPIPTNKYHGMFIEMKTKSGKTSIHQKQWLEKLNMNNYYACVCYSADEAICKLKFYLNQ